MPEYLVNKVLIIASLSSYTTIRYQARVLRYQPGQGPEVPTKQTKFKHKYTLVQSWSNWFWALVFSSTRDPMAVVR